MEKIFAAIVLLLVSHQALASPIHMLHCWTDACMPAAESPACKEVSLYWEPQQKHSDSNPKLRLARLRIASKRRATFRGESQPTPENTAVFSGADHKDQLLHLEYGGSWGRVTYALSDALESEELHCRRILHPPDQN